jgi:hypothetical protein
VKITDALYGDGASRGDGSGGDGNVYGYGHGHKTSSRRDGTDIYYTIPGIGHGYVSGYGSLSMNGDGCGNQNSFRSSRKQGVA